MEFVVNGHFGTGADALPNNVSSASVRVYGELENLKMLDELFLMSVRVSEVLDQLGYSESMVRYRCEATERLDGILNRHRTDYFGITIGSKQEGYCCPFESDRDVMFIHKTVICRLQVAGSSPLPDTHTEFIMDNEYCNPGYYRLELKHKAEGEDSNITAAMVEHINGREYVSSEKYTYLFRKSFNLSTVSGPALTECNDYQSWDYVFALPCISQKQLLSEWINRPRYHNWPSPELIQEIPQLPAYLVPVGCKSSENKHMEWRVCFIGELKLTDSFMESQYKLYILLKYINKHVLKPICKDMSSFIMKNVVFWYVESTSRESFSIHNLVVNIISCLKMLQQSIRENNLPYYMIRGRNLLRGRINLTQHHHLIAKLDELIQEGPIVIMRCPKVRLALQMPSAELIKQGRWRDKLEKLWVEMWNMWWAYCLPGIEVEEMFRQAGRSHSFINVWQEMNDLVWPQWRLYQGQDFPTIYRRKILIALK
ncbi:uncharacterized protein LOC128236220 [Mya arenaria]|nr:uncharacterized protein LOC128236220 [Mya arenaria]